jgi:hypothetical protein
MFPELSLIEYRGNLWLLLLIWPRNNFLNLEWSLPLNRSRHIMKMCCVLLEYASLWWPTTNLLLIVISLRFIFFPKESCCVFFVKGTILFYFWWLIIIGFSYCSKLYIILFIGLPEEFGFVPLKNAALWFGLFILTKEAGCVTLVKFRVLVNLDAGLNIHETFAKCLRGTGPLVPRVKELFGVAIKFTLGVWDGYTEELFCVMIKVWMFFHLNRDI